MGFDVFISYPHEDKATADAACAKLEAEGIRCWIAPRDIAPSADWAASIVEAIDECRVMVLIFSGHTNRSKQVHREVQQAFDGEKPVVPFRIEDVNPQKSLRYYMGSVHWLDALSPPLEQHLKKLATSVLPLVRTPTPARETEANDEQFRHERQAESDGEVEDRRQLRHPKVLARPWQSRRAIMLVSLICMAVFGAFGLWRVLSPLPGSIAPAPVSITPIQIVTSVLSPGSERTLKPKSTFKECDRCPEMVVVPAGQFDMGSPPGEQGQSDEAPLHRVTIAQPFAVSKFELTFDEWDACASYRDCAPSVSDSGWGRGQRPVINVSWQDAQDYVAWLSRMTSEPYRLLTEVEYEYATRGGMQTAYPWGAEVQVNRRAMANCVSCGSQWDNRQTAPVGSFAPNKFGLYDMVGNVREWVEDCYHPNYEKAPTDGSAWEAACPDDRNRVLRGGSWNSDPPSLRSAHRYHYVRDFQYSSLGFRVGRTLNQ